MCLTVISIIVVYFFYPETKKKSLEELAAYFGETVITDPVTGLEKDKHNGSSWDEKNESSTAHAEQMS